MAYYYYYQQQQHHSVLPPSSGPLPSTSSAAETPPPTTALLTPVLLTSANLLGPSPVAVMVTPNVATGAADKHRPHSEPPTPNTFLRHCDDLGLFHDLLRVDGGVFVQQQQPTSGCGGKETETATAAMTTTPGPPTLGLFTTTTAGSASSSAFVMANPFDETFRRAVVQQQQQRQDGGTMDSTFTDDAKAGDLNTPFIGPSQPPPPVQLPLSPPSTATVHMTASDVKGDVATTVLPSATTTTIAVQTKETAVIDFHPQHQRQQDVFITPSKVSATDSAPQVLLMMVHHQVTDNDGDGQQSQTAMVSVRNNNEQQQHRHIVPTTAVDTTITTEATTATTTSTASTRIKQALKHTLVKRLRHIPDDCELQNVQDSNGDAYKISEDSDSLQQQRKRELLDRNKTAARRCRAKRKRRWELLQEENRRLRLENGRLRAILQQLQQANVVRTDTQLQ